MTEAEIIEAIAQDIVRQRAANIVNLQDADWYVNESAEYDHRITEGNDERIANRVAEILNIQH